MGTAWTTSGYKQHDLSAARAIPAASLVAVLGEVRWVTGGRCRTDSFFLVMNFVFRSELVFEFIGFTAKPDAPTPPLTPVHDDLDSLAEAKRRSWKMAEMPG